MISIVVVFRILGEEFNDLWELTGKSLNGINRTADEEYEIIVIDNGSHDSRYADTLNRSSTLWGEMFPLIRGIRILRFDDHVSLAKAWNTGVHQADGDYLMIANNDIVYHEQGWMSRMLEPFSWDEEERLNRLIENEVGIAGIQHMSWRYFAFTEGSLFVFPKRFVEELAIEDADTPYPMVFDEQFTMSCEDVDFNYRVQKHGFATIQVDHPALQPHWLQHLGHRTINTLAGTDESIVNLTHENRIRLCEKWEFDPVVND